MRSIKNFTHKSYICNISTVLKLSLLSFVILISFFSLTACDTSSTDDNSIDEATIDLETDAPNSDEKKAIEKAESRSLEIASIYKEIYINAEKTISDENYGGQTIISQDVVDEIESLLIEQGYSVMNSNSQYPSYLENSDCFYEFWESVCNNKDAEQEIISVSETGGIFYSILQFSDGKSHRTSISLNWNSDNEPEVSYSEYVENDDWSLTDRGNFYYKSSITGVPFDDYLLIRLKPVDESMYDLAEKYITPIGYLSNNMFVSEWSYQDYSNLSFNDLFEFLYKVKNNDYFYHYDYENISAPYWHINIPASLFEETIMPFFDIPLQEFRERSLYDSETNNYPWQEICCENVTFYPTVEAEVTNYQENADGTFMLTVNARCNDYKTDCLFTHEVTIRPLENGDYQYLSNKITYKSDITMPPNNPRLPPQQINDIQQ